MKQDKIHHKIDEDGHDFSQFPIAVLYTRVKNGNL